MLRAENLYKRFDDLAVLNGVSLSVTRGEVVAILGASGGGKSTLLRCLTGLERVERGGIAIGGRALCAAGPDGRAVYPHEKIMRQVLRPVGLVFQGFNLFPHFSVLRNLTEAQVLLGRPQRDAREKALALLHKVGLSDKADQYPYQLSGGQSQRVAIARALALDPDLLCFDEPTSALDPRLTQEVLGVIRALAAERRTMLVVTHEVQFAREVSDRVILMQDGVVLDEGTPDVVLGKDASLAMRSFLGAEPQ
ncbi:MAG: amino acid ABC transporter ATP-binding protein [Oscillospiraceae bacterium]|jgi:polar amino acid transport system ATP-binding protein|nr:amino acid ABC transporter ATP-binding protein [Oscillospiraceae bacterium]